MTPFSAAAHDAEVNAFGLEVHCEGPYGAGDRGRETATVGLRR